MQLVLEQRNIFDLPEIFAAGDVNVLEQLTISTCFDNLSKFPKSHYLSLWPHLLSPSLC